MSGSPATSLPPAPSRLRPLLGEIGDLKRIRSAGQVGSIASRGFCRAWCELAGGADPVQVMRHTTAAALVAARLGDLDGPKLRELGLSGEDADAVIARAFDAVAGSLDHDLAAELRAALVLEPPDHGQPPLFVSLLDQQPRAGATCPGKPRIVLEPPENHAEHCWAVAVFGVLMSPAYRAEPTTVFLAGLSHHLHNAAMPDSGFTGEMLLEPHLSSAMSHATDAALAQLDDPLRCRIVEARRILPDVTTPEGQAFHAADVVDRVMQIAQHLRAASTTMADVLGDMALVHDGPVKPFHDAVLADMDLP